MTEYIVEKYFLYRYDRTGTYRYDRTGSSRFNLATGRRVIFAHPIEIQLEVQKQKQKINRRFPDFVQ